MNNNSSKQILLSVIGVAILVIAVVGVSFAFFSYVYNGANANEVNTGTIVFSASDTNLSLENVFPTTVTEAATATVSVSGSTTYAEGIKFEVRVKDVTAKNNAIIPKVLVTPKDAEGVEYTTGTAGITVTYDKVNSLSSVENGVICAGTIAEGEEVNAQILEIKAFYDKDQYHITDNTKQELIDADLLAEDYPGEIVSTDDWTALSATGAAYSFRIEVIAVEGDSNIPRIQ